MKPLVRVEWLDTVGSCAWETADEVNILRVDQVGWLVNESTWPEEGSLKLADTISDDVYYGITAIPKGCIRKITSLSFTTDAVEVF